jgi:hypothetical protein
MVYFAKIGMSSEVIWVTPFDENQMLDADNNPDETIAQQILEERHGWPSQMWIQCDINTYKGKYYTPGSNWVLDDNQSKAFRANFPSLGDIWNSQYQIFHEQKPIDKGSWTLNTTTGKYEAPVTYPTITTYTVDSDNAEQVAYYNDKVSRGLASNNTLNLHIGWNETLTRWESKGHFVSNFTHYWNSDTSSWVSI